MSWSPPSSAKHLFQSVPVIEMRGSVIYVTLRLARQARQLSSCTFTLHRYRVPCFYRITPKGQIALLSPQLTYST